MPMRTAVALLALGLLALSPAHASAADACDFAIPPADQRAALDDTSGASEDVPHGPRGTPYAIDWMHHGRLNLGNAPGKFRLLMPWSAIFAAPGNARDRATAEIRDMRLLMLSKRTGTWRELVSSGEIVGGYYSRDVGKGRRLAPLAAAGSAAGTRIALDDRYMAHFWPKSPRRAIDPDDVAGVLVIAEARIDPADYAAGARYLMNAAADYWLDERATFDNYKSNGDAGIGRLKLLTPEWRRFYMTTADAAGLARCVAPPGG
jgi:hypothetical protein